MDNELYVLNDNKLSIKGKYYTLDDENILKISDNYLITLTKVNGSVIVSNYIE